MGIPVKRLAVAAAAVSLAWHVCGMYVVPLFFVWSLLYLISWNVLKGWRLKSKPASSRQIPLSPIHPCMQLSATQLSKALEDGTYTSEFVVNTYIAHIERVNPYMNAMVFDCFDDARQQAKEADRIWDAWRRGGRREAHRPPWLTGVPCTIKESISVRGCPNVSGQPHRRHIVAEEDAPPVASIRAAGAIILGVTNTSELCMWMESSNYVYGITANAFDTRCLVGGSSGGEGAAHGAAFATFGLGADIGGSIRMPAFFNGVFGIKPSSHTVPNSGQHPMASAGANHMLSTGPITRFAEDLLPLAATMAGKSFGMDPSKYPPPFEHMPSVPVDILRTYPKGGKRKLRVYVVEDYGLHLIPVAASQREVLADAARCLENRCNAEIIYVNNRDKKRCTGGIVPKGFSIFSNVFPLWSVKLMADPDEHRFTDMMGEGHRNNRIIPLFELLKWCFGQSQHTLPAIGLCVIEQFELYISLNFLKQRNRHIADEGIANVRQTLGKDAVIMAPTYPRPAPRHHSPLLIPLEWQYTAVFNLLALPTTNIPMWTLPARHCPCGPSPDASREQGRPKDYHLPKGVQVAANVGEDALSAGVASLLEKEFGGYRYPHWAVLQ